MSLLRFAHDLLEDDEMQERFQQDPDPEMDNYNLSDEAKKAIKKRQWGKIGRWLIDEIKQESNSKIPPANY